jgi:hypothetical protein
MSDRFEDWKPPIVEHGKLTEYNWLVQNPDGLKLGYKSDIVPSPTSTPSTA